MNTWVGYWSCDNCGAEGDSSSVAYLVTPNSSVSLRCPSCGRRIDLKHSIERDQLREKVAALCHDQWSGWMRYLFSKSERYMDAATPTPDDNVVIPQGFVERWMRQMNTPYSELSQSEQDSDRKEADKFLKLLSLVRD